MSALYRLPVNLFVHGGISLLVAIAFVIPVALIIYRVAMTAVFHGLRLRAPSLLASISSAVLNLIFITLLNVLYRHVALWLNEYECWRSQSQFNKQYTIKIYVLQFVNYYTAIFYMAFFKGRSNFFLYILQGFVFGAQGDRL